MVHRERDAGGVLTPNHFGTDDQHVPERRQRAQLEFTRALAVEYNRH
jgi:hypothetical protein